LGAGPLRALLGLAGAGLGAEPLLASVAGALSLGVGVVAGGGVLGSGVR